MMRKTALAFCGALMLGAGVSGSLSPAHATGYGFYEEGPEVVTRRIVIEKPVVYRPRVVREVIVERPIIHRPQRVVKEVIIKHVGHPGGFYEPHPFGPRSVGYDFYD